MEGYREQDLKAEAQRQKLRDEAGIPRHVYPHIRRKGGWRPLYWLKQSRVAK